MDSELISIIVCIYNKEFYLPRCLDSLINQTYQNIEIICIDDGSEDKSLQICKLYADRDHRLKVYKQTNAGVANARQKGLDLANGTWVIYCDPDDWMDVSMVEKLYEKSKKEKTSLVWCDFFVDDNVHSTVCHQNISSVCVEKMIQALVTSEILGTMWNKLIRKAVIEKSNMAFDQKMAALEDLVFLVGLLSTLPNMKLSYVNEPLYHYYQSAESILHSMNNDKTYKNYVYAIESMSSMIPVKKYDDLYFYKKIVIGSLYKMGGGYKQMHSVYPEIHERLLSELSWRDKFTLYYFSLIGFPRIGKIIEKLKIFIKKYCR